METVLLKVVQEIAKAAETARQNRARCRDLADRACTIHDTLRDYKAGGGAATSRKSALDRLKTALDDALELVRCCRRRRIGFGWLVFCLASGSTAAGFLDVETRITACVVDLGLEKQLLAAVHDRPGHRANTRPGSWKEEGTNRSVKKRYGDMNGRNERMMTDADESDSRRSRGSAAAARNARTYGGMAEGRQVRGEAAATTPPPQPWGWRTPPPLTRHSRCALHSSPQRPQAQGQHYVVMDDHSNSCSVM